MRRPLVLVVAVAVALASLAQPADAQEPGSTITTATAPTVAVPSQDIVPQPNSGAAPQEAGDRGGALQLGLLAVVMLAIGGAVLRLVRQSRRARGPVDPA
ncbi:MAG: hypothetical protein ABL966_04805 [Acidimicrobiales bacterium]